MTLLEAADQTELALSMIHTLLLEKPATPTLSSIYQQLEFLKNELIRPNGLDDLPRFTFGILAAKEDYDLVYPELANILHNLSHFVRRLPQDNSVGQTKIT